MNFFFENLSLVPETRAPKEHFKLVFGSGTSDLAKIRPLKIGTHGNFSAGGWGGMKVVPLWGKPILGKAEEKIIGVGNLLFRVRH